MKIRLIVVALAALLVGGGASAEDLRIGFINTLKHPLGRGQVNGFKLGLEHLGWKKNGDMINGVPVSVTYCDDQFKPDSGLACARRLMNRDKVQIIAGILWSNILNAIRTPVVRNKTILMSLNAGSAKLAGVACSKYFISTSWQNDQNAEAMGVLLREEGLKNVFLMSVNYQAGKDVLNGVLRGYNNNKSVNGRLLFKLGNRDFQSELTRIRAAKPDALVVFAPGPMGISFMKQWGASGLGKSIKLYQVYVVDFLTLIPIGKAAMGTFHTNHWDADSTATANQRFIKTYIAKHRRHPNHFEAQAYDGALLIASGIKGVGGKVGNTLALMKAMRKANYASVRGPYKYNVNGIPIQNFYKREVVMGANGKPTIKTVGVVLADNKDAYWKKCKKSEWIR